MGGGRDNYVFKVLSHYFVVGLRNTTIYLSGKLISEPLFLPENK